LLFGVCKHHCRGNIYHWGPISLFWRYRVFFFDFKKLVNVASFCFWLYCLTGDTGFVRFLEPISRRFGLGLVLTFRKHCVIVDWQVSLVFFHAQLCPRPESWHFSQYHYWHSIQINRKHWEMNLYSSRLFDKTRHSQ